MGLAELKKRHARLKSSLQALGPAIQGTILPRVIHREDPEHPGRAKDYGPYYQWTRKINGRTVLQNLTASQAKAYAAAIRENRKMERIIAEIRATSLTMLELTTQGVRKRKPKSPHKKPLS